MRKIIYMLMTLALMILLTACVSGFSVPTAPKQNTYKKTPNRSYAEMKDKLSKIRKPIHGVHLSKQKRYTRSSVDDLLKEAKYYHNEIKKFEKAHAYKIKKKKIKKRVLVVNNKDINKTKEEDNELKYY